MDAKTKTSPAIPNEWTSLIGEKVAIGDCTWLTSSPPSELLYYPQQNNIPPKLLEILQWSLERSQPEPRTDNHLTEDNHTVITREKTVVPMPTLASSASTKPDNADDAVSQTSSTRQAMAADTIAAAMKRISALKARHAARVAQRKLSKASSDPQLAECTSCFDDFKMTDLTRLACTHFYCKNCLTTLIMTSIQTESSYPPKCCLTEIPTSTVVKALDRFQMVSFKSKAAEYSFPADRRFYCPNADCAKWIPPSRFRSSTSASKCPSCPTKICTQCRGRAHGNRIDCPRDGDLQATIDLAEANGWRRCYRCREMVELSVGCLHMTCRCGAQFCYACAAPWRTCSCTETNEAARQAELERRRVAAQRREQEEDEHFRRSMTVIARIEAKAAQERIRREAEEAERLRMEEEQLLRLEQERLAEEELRRQQEWAFEQELKEILEASLQTESKRLLDGMLEVIRLHHVMFDNKHGHNESELINKYETAVAEHQSRRAQITKKLNSGGDQSLEDLKAEHEQQLQDLAKQHEEQADELFMKIHLYLKNKPNKEAREKKMLAELKDTQQAEKFTLHAELHQAYDKTAAVKKRELDLLERAIQSRFAKAQSQHQAGMKQLIFRASIERKWYLSVSERRLAMVKEHNIIMAEELAQGIDPVGLTAEKAAAILPLPAYTQESLDPTMLDVLSISTDSAMCKERSGAARVSGSASKASSFSFVSARDFASTISHTDKVNDSNSSESDAILTDLSILSGHDPAKCNERRLTPDENPDEPRNGPGWVAAKRGEPSTPRLSVDIPDVSSPPSSPDSLVFSPVLSRSQRKRRSLFISNEPSVSSFGPPVTRGALIRPTHSRNGTFRPSLAPEAPSRAPLPWSYYNGPVAIEDKTGPRLFRAPRMKRAKLSARQKEKWRSTSDKIHDCENYPRNRTGSSQPSIRSRQSSSRGLREGNKLRRKASQILAWTFKKKVVLP